MCMRLMAGSIVLVSFLLIAPLPGGPAPAAAQEQTRSSLLARVAKSCQPETVRFCPELGEKPMPQDQLICLRPYKINLSLNCRSAIQSASQ